MDTEIVQVGADANINAANIRAALDGESSFYAQHVGFDLPAEERVSPIEIRRANRVDG